MTDKIYWEYVLVAVYFISVLSLAISIYALWELNEARRWGRIWAERTRELLRDNERKK